MPQRRTAQHGHDGADGGGIRLGAARKPRCALPDRPSGREAGAGASYLYDAGRGTRDRGVAGDGRRTASSAADHRLIGVALVTTPASLLKPEAFLSPLAIEEAVQRALAEDLGRAGDITSIATIPEATKAHAVLIARQSGVIAGLPLAVATLQKLSPDINIQAHFRDG